MMDFVSKMMDFELKPAGHVPFPQPALILGQAATRITAPTASSSAAVAAGAPPRRVLVYRVDEPPADKHQADLTELRHQRKERL